MRKLYLVFFSLIFLFFGMLSTRVYGTEMENDKLENGTYIIKSALNQNMVLDIEGANNANGANVELWQDNGGLNQRFELKDVGDGCYEIIAVHSGKLLDVKDEGKVNGTNVQQCERTDCDAQKWFIKDVGNGYYTVVSKCNGLVLDVEWAWARNGSNIQLCEETSNNNAQRFYFKKIEELKGEKVIDDGFYQIETALNKNYVVEIANASTVNGANVQIWQNKKTRNQIFKIKYNENGYYEIEALHSGKLFDVQNEGRINGTNIQQCERTNCNAQRWILKQNGNGYYSIISKCNGLALDVDWGWARNGGNIQVCEQTVNNDAQRFAFKRVDEEQLEIGKRTIEDGIYQIQSVLNSNYVVEVANSSNNNGANIQIWQNRNIMSQKFEVKYNTEGYYEIIAMHSGKLFDVQNEGMVNGTNVQQCERTNCDAQRWIIKDNGNGLYSVISRCNNLCLDVSWGWARNGSNIQLCEETGNNMAQQFKFVKAKSLDEKTYKISMKRNSNKFLDIEYASWYNNANLQICSEGSSKAQMFNIQYVDNTYFKIIAMHSNKLLTVLDNENVCQSDTGGDNQLWSVSLADNGCFYIVSKKNGKYLTVEGNNTANGTNICVYPRINSESQMFKFEDITVGKSGTYGKSGMAYKGYSNRTDLKYYKYGCGENVFFAIFEVHGFEDHWNYDGQVLTNIANDFYNRLVSDKNQYIAKNWTVYVIPNVNPDGLNYGWTNNGPGRTTVYSAAPGNRGIDINRSWEIPGYGYKRYTDDRNYNGTGGFQAYEATALRNFLQNNKSYNGQTVLIDLHGWENSFIGDQEIGSKYFAPNFPSATKKYNSYGNQYLITWAKTVLGARSALVELPDWIYSNQDVVNNNLSGKYIDSVLNMLNNMYVSSPIRRVPQRTRVVTDEEQFNVAFAGMVKKSLPTEDEVNELAKKMPAGNGVWIEESSRNRVLKLINSLTNFEYGVDENGYLELVSYNELENEYDVSVNKLIASDEQYVFASTGNLYYRDIVSYVIDCSNYEEHDGYQTYDYVQSGDKLLIDVSSNSKGGLTDKEIFDSVIRLLED